MSDLAQTVLVGRLTRDAELKYTPSGTAILHFSVATSAKVKSGDQWTDYPSFWDVDLWGKLGESIAQYMTKGKQVAVSGTMSIQRWEKDGEKKQKVVITAQTVCMLGGGKDSASVPAETAPVQEKPAAPAPINAAKVQEMFGKKDLKQAAKHPHQTVVAADGFEDEIPF